ncbi:unnamed protein product [Brassicogethes aeneus]|uniref:ATP synthase subunit g n=1 Tax=Brassicogethes aeneus TaxID=1431903 RepID=A0A9P0FKH1_BRAAE|nr:unnamed protein product [Brassicogethes aeneus]
MAKLLKKIPVLAEKIAEEARPRIAVFVKYAKVELIPPTPGEIPKVVFGFGRLVKAATTFSWRNLTVREAWLNTLVATEVGCWFYVGECIGKGHIVGYKV